MKKKKSSSKLKIKRPLKITHVIFDWSGTLYNDHGPSYFGTRDLFKHFKKEPISKKVYQDTFELPADRFYKKHGMNQSLDELNELYFKIYEKHFLKGKLFEGVKPLLECLKKNKITVSLFSTVRQDLLETLCKRDGLTKYISKISGSVCDKIKELPAHLKELKLNPETTLFVGDMDHDVLAAKAHGLMQGCVLSGYHNVQKLLDAKAQFVWTEPKHIKPFIESLFLQKIIPAKERVIATSGALVLNKKKECLLVLTPKWGYTYGIPGGKIEYGESAAQAAKRELFEETGLKILVKDLLIVQDSIDSPLFYKTGSHFILFNYLAHAASDQVKLNDEAVSYLWIDPKQALKLNLNHPTRVLIEAYLNQASH